MLTQVSIFRAKFSVVELKKALFNLPSITGRLLS